MEGSTSFVTPDLQAILATLSQYPQIPHNVNVTTPERSASATPEIATPSQEELRHLSQDGPTISAESLASNDERPRDPRIKPQCRSTPASQRPQIDPATITVWNEALRCVTKIAAQNTAFAPVIKRMMADQKSNEMRWYQDRQALKQTQANRSTEQAKAHSILKSLNTSFYGTPPEVNTPEVDQQKELDAFDKKIYLAQQTMETAMMAELKSLGVPFCGTDPALIVPDKSDAKIGEVPEGRPKYSQVITQTQLLKMRRKMIAHLEDLYRD